MGSHSETIQIDYDPAQISYGELLDLFWSSHTPTSTPWSRQYASIIFYHNEEQQRLALETLEREATQHQDEIYTEIVPFAGFYLAETYHQKYRLQEKPDLMQEFNAIYPDDADFINSTAAARVNGYVGGYGSLEALRAEINGLDLSPEAWQRLLDLIESSGP